MGKRYAVMVVLLLCMALLTGCGFNYPGKAYFDRLAAERALARSVELVKKESPMTEIEGREMTGPPHSPFVFYGRDKEGRPLAAWVSYAGESIYGHHYLDSGITKEQAIEKIEAAGYDVEFRIIVLVGPDKPFWLAQCRDPQSPGFVYFARVDQQTGELTIKKNGS